MKSLNIESELCKGTMPETCQPDVGGFENQNVKREEMNEEGGL